MNPTPAIGRELRRLEELGPLWQRSALGLGVVGLVGGAALSAWSQGLPGMFRSYIVAYAFCLSLALGGLFFVILQHLTRAGWSVVVRRIAEAVAGTMPVMTLLFLPIVVPVVMGMGDVYPWSVGHAKLESEHDSLILAKASYLNATWFLIRWAIYFTVWTWLASFFVGRSIEQDSTGDPQLTARMQAVSAPAMIAYALTQSLAAIDLIKSLEPHWFSTMFGVYFFSGSAVGFFCLLALLMILLQSAGRLTQSINTEHYHDVGKLIFAFVVFWTYIAFSQYMLIWYANLPEETIWYFARQGDGWSIGLSLFLLTGHFLLPFVTIISRVPKRNPRFLLIAAAWVLLMHYFDIFWLIKPRIEPALENGVHAAFQPSFAPAALAGDVAMIVGVGGLFFAAIAWRMSRAALLPERDPRLHESLAFQNF
ncbi:MAG: quinol:cytochrome C oxidoreductase [Phycisphaerae bacterium]